MAFRTAGVASDTEDLTCAATEIHVGTSGYVKMTLFGGETIERQLDPGVYYFHVKRLWATPAGSPAAGDVQAFV
jgi:hypothetical protein